MTNQNLNIWLLKEETKAKDKFSFHFSTIQHLSFNPKPETRNSKPILKNLPCIYCIYNFFYLFRFDRIVG